MRLLVVEDEHDLRRAIVQSLSEQGFAVDKAEDGENGLYMSLAWEYDAIVLVIMFPILNGWRFGVVLRGRLAGLPDRYQSR